MESVVNYGERVFNTGLTTKTFPPMNPPGPISAPVDSKRRDSFARLALAALIQKFPPGLAEPVPGGFDNRAVKLQHETLARSAAAYADATISALDGAQPKDDRISELESLLQIRDEQNANQGELIAEQVDEIVRLKAELAAACEERDSRYSPKWRELQHPQDDSYVLTTSDEVKYRASASWSAVEGLAGRPFRQLSSAARVPVDSRPIVPVPDDLYSRYMAFPSGIPSGLVHTFILGVQAAGGRVA